MTLSRQAARLILLATVFLVLGACGREEKPTTEQAQRSAATTQTTADPPINIAVGHVGHDHQLALYVAALESERFAESGTYLESVKKGQVYDLVDGGQPVARLVLTKVGGGARMPAAMSRGEIDVGFGGVAAVARFADQGQPFRIILPLQTDGDMLVMQADSPINDWSQFVDAALNGPRPLKIGYKAPVAVAKLVFVGALEAANIPYSLDEGELEHGVVLVNMMSEQSPLPLLASGSIDGFVMNQPAVAVAVHAGQAKVIADLRNLPPDGRWVDHPCCCVATTATVIEERPDVIEALVRLIVLSTQLIHEDPQLAIDVASRWTKNDRQVEAASIPTIHYLAEPTDRWRAGMVNWAELMQDVGAFEDRYAEMSPEQVVDDLLALQFAERVIAELRAEGVLHD